MRTIVVGGAGFIGRHLCRRLTTMGEEVVALDVTTADGEPFESRPFDAARDAPDCEGADAVIYLSQSPHYRDFDQHGHDLFAVNVVGALRAATTAQSAGVGAFLYASTGSVYAPSFGPLPEDAPVRRDDPYALSKLTAEEGLGLLDTSMRVLAFRLFGVFGPGQQTMLVPAIRGRVERGDPITLEANPNDPKDDGGLRISLTYVDDAVAGIVALRDRALEGADLPPALNLAAPEATSLRDLGRALGDELGIEPSFETLDKTRTSDFVADIGQLRRCIQPEFTTFAEGIAKTVQGT